MYELRIKFNDGELKKYNYSNIDKLNKDIIKMYAKYKIVNGKYEII